IEAYVAIKFAVRRIARITFFRAPDLPARIAIASERSWTGRRVTRRIDRALRLRISKEQTVRIQNEPANVRFLQNRIDPRRVSAFGQPKTVWTDSEKIDICVAADENLGARSF